MREGIWRPLSFSVLESGPSDDTRFCAESSPPGGSDAAWLLTANRAGLHLACLSIVGILAAYSVEAQSFSTSLLPGVNYDESTWLRWSGTKVLVAADSFAGVGVWLIDADNGPPRSTPLSAHSTLLTCYRGYKKPISSTLRPLSVKGWCVRSRRALRTLPGFGLPLRRRSRRGSGQTGRPNSPAQFRSQIEARSRGSYERREPRSNSEDRRGS